MPTPQHPRPSRPHSPHDEPVPNPQLLDGVNPAACSHPEDTPADALPHDPAPVKDTVPREVWVLVACAFVIAIGFGFIAPALPQFAVSFGVGVFAASMLISSFAFTRLVFTPASGRAVDRFGERRTYLWGILLVAASTGACAFAQDYWQLLVFRSLGGVGSTMFTVSASTMLVRLSPPGIRGRTASYYASSFLIGGVIGPVLGGALSGFGLRVPFAVYAVLLVMAATLAGVFLRGAHLRPADQQQPREKVTFTELFRGDSAFRAAVITGFGAGWANFGVRIALIPLFVVAAYKATPHDVGTAMAAFALGNATALTLGGGASDRWGRKPLIFAGIALSAAMTGAIGWVTSWPLFLTMSVLAGIGVGLYGPAQQAVVADVIGRDRNGARALAGFQMATDIGAIGGPIVAGLLVEHTGYGVAFALTATVMILGAGAWSVAREPHPVRRPDAQPESDVPDQRAA